jgi:hypothetical protein
MPGVIRNDLYCSENGAWHAWSLDELGIRHSGPGCDADLVYGQFLLQIYTRLWHGPLPEDLLTDHQRETLEHVRGLGPYALMELVRTAESGVATLALVGCHETGALGVTVFPPSRTRVRGLRVVLAALEAQAR